MTRHQIGDGSIIDVEADPRDAQIETLRAEKRRLEREVSDANLRADRAREDADRALSNLRRQLGPLYRALQLVFGELDAAGVTNDVLNPPNGSVAAPNGRRDARELALWEDWKSKLPDGCARVIAALLTHDDLSVKQIETVAKMGRQTAYQSTSKLGQLGLLTKNGGRFSLRAL